MFVMDRLVVRFFGCCQFSMGNKAQVQSDRPPPKKGGQKAIDPKEDPTRILSRAYILALGLIAFLTISSHMVTAHISDEQKAGQEIAYQIGKQRNMIQQIILYAGNYFRMGESLDYDFVMQSIGELDNSHKYMTTAVQEKIPLGDYRSPALYRIYYNPPFNLDERIVEFINTARDFAKYDPKDQNESRIKKRKEVMDKLTEQANNALKPALDAALEIYQAESLDKVTRYYKIQLNSALLILLVLLAEAILIFRPLIEKIRNYNGMLQRYALEDSLTGLNNRRAFMNAAEVELQRAQREHTPVTVALLDLDHFKQVNDTYGHEVGDRVLQHFSNILRRAFRAGDITGRIGGEEFAIILPRISHKGAVKILQRLCDRVAATPCPYKDENDKEAFLNYTLSIGYTGPTEITTQTIDELLGSADEGLYKAKEEGRNRLSSTDPK